MHIVAVGLSHRTAPVDVREKIVVAAADLPEVLAGLKATRGICEGVLVSTCNRTEFYAVVEEAHRDSARLTEMVSELG